MKKNINFEQFNLDQKSRAEDKNQKPLCLWLTGLSGSGKSTLANALEQRLKKLKKAYLYFGWRQPSAWT